MADALPRVFGPYELLARLGQGAAGAAYLARPLADRPGVPSPVVIKCLHAQLVKEDEFVRRFRHEAEIAVRIDGPNVAKTYDVGAVGDELYIALEYIPGWTFGRLLSIHVNNGLMIPIDVACGLAVHAALGLESIHTARDSRGRSLDAVHRDVSPKNVMLGDDGVVRIIDLGLGKSNAQDWKTGAGRVMGSPGYMSFEQCRGSAVDRRADVYAVAVILHELLTSQRYIPLKSSVAMLVAALEKAYVPVRSIRKEAPEALDQTIRSAMARNVEQRTPTAAAFADAVRASAPIADVARLAAWHTSVLADAQARRVEEVARLLALPLPMDDGPPIAKTVVFVQRDDVGALPPPTKIVDMMPDSSSPMASLPASMFSVRRPSRWPQVALVVAALLIGFAGGAWLTGGPEPVEVLDVPTKRAVLPTVRPSAAPVVVEVPAAEPAAEPAVEPAVEPPAPIRTARRPERRPAAEPIDEPTPPERAAPLERIKRLEARVLAIGGRDAAKLLAQLSMVRAAGDTTRAAAQLDRIEASVVALERQD